MVRLCHSEGMSATCSEYRCWAPRTRLATGGLLRHRIKQLECMILQGVRFGGPKVVGNVSRVYVALPVHDRDIHDSGSLGFGVWLQAGASGGLQG